MQGKQTSAAMPILILPRIFGSIWIPVLKKNKKKMIYLKSVYLLRVAEYSYHRR